jgi:hypothetical protein
MNDEFMDFITLRRLHLLHLRIKNTCAKIESPRKKKKSRSKKYGKALTGFLAAALPPALAIYDKWSKQQIRPAPTKSIISALYDLLNKINVHIGEAKVPMPPMRTEALSNDEERYALAELTTLNNSIIVPASSYNKK